jgi:hypothetical protein
MNVTAIVSGACSMEIEEISWGMVGHVCFHAVGPYMLLERAILLKISASNGWGPTSGNEEAEPWLL